MFGKERKIVGSLASLSLMAVALAGPARADEAKRQPEKTFKKGDKIEILCSFFPVYLFTKNVVGDRPNVTVSLMIPAEKGCPHDYDLTPGDIKRIMRSDIFILNGGGIEEFGDQQVKQANAKIVLIDSSTKVAKMASVCEECHDHEHEDADHKHDHDKDHKHDAKKDKEEEHEHEHHHHAGGKNPHFFSSPIQAALQVEEIAEQLSRLDPDGAATYKQNADAYAKRLRDVGAEFQKQSAKFKNRKIVTMHEVFDYLARDFGLEVVATITSSPGKDPSAKKMRELIDKMKKTKPAAVFTEPQYSERVANVVAKGAQVKTGELDPVASGPADAPLDYYEKTMRKNLQTLTKYLGSAN